jgi:hypothetical protein
MSKILSNTTAGIEPLRGSADYYKEYCTMDLETMTMNGGFKAGEMAITMASGTGKSSLHNVAYYAAMFDSIFKPQPLSDIKLDEGRIYGARYYTVEPVGGSWKNMEQWCEETFGPHGGAVWGNEPPFPNKRWYMNNRKFWFRTEKDRDWFLLRWRS